MAKGKMAKVGSRCPRCESKDLLEFDGDQFCTECSWDSLKMSVERGDLDDAIYEYEEKLAEENKNTSQGELVTVDISGAGEIDGSAA